MEDTSRPNMNPTESTFRTADQLNRASVGLARLEPGTKHRRLRCVVVAAEVKTTKRGDPYLDIRLGDRTGQANAKCWDGAALADRLAPGTVVELATVDVDEWGPKFEAGAIKWLKPGDYEARDFIQSLPEEQIEHNWRVFNEVMDTIEDPHLQRLRQAVFSEPEVSQKYKTHPSGIRRHHNYLGGNVEHVLGIIRVVDAVCKSYHEIDRDLVVFGGAIHDLGKLREYAYDTRIYVTEEGRLAGHLVIGAEWLGQIISRVRTTGYDFPAGLEAHLRHMILSHHRKGEWGSPKPPATPEAFLLHMADYADSQAKGFLQDVAENRGAQDGWAMRWDSDAGQKLWIRTDPTWD